jgi:hypothetical protein
VQGEMLRRAAWSPTQGLPFPADQVRPDAPLRLSVAAAVAFADGSMTASGLRREAAERVGRQDE